MIKKSNSDLVLTFSWGNFTHGVSGHLFECIEYYYILKDHFKVEIVIPEYIKNYELIIRDKYTFSDKEVQDILDNTTIVPSHKGEFLNLLVAKNILFVDGGYTNTKKCRILGQKIYFACGDFTVLDQDDPVLLDYRVYPKIPKNSFNYKKKVLLSKIKKPNKSDNKILIYATENCRDTDYELKNSLKLRKKDLPVLNLFQKFDTYLYTPVQRRFDCSSRFLVECKYLDKKIEFHPEVLKYFNEDLGLYWRWYDIQNNFYSLELKLEDEIVDIIKQIIS